MNGYTSFEPANDPERAGVTERALALNRSDLCVVEYLSRHIGSEVADQGTAER